MVFILHHADVRRYANRGALVVLRNYYHLVERLEIIRHATTGPSDRCGCVAEQGVRLLAQDGGLATGDAVRITVARNLCGRSFTNTNVIIIGLTVAQETSETVLCRPTSEWRKLYR